ncbi:MAG TPA: IS256 family transposase [Nitrospira sp.]|nr:IS256 family transposase [Nitrospira sp.]
MTDDSMAFQRWLEQHGGEDFLRALMERTLEQLMEFEVSHRIGASRHERNAERQNYRNGYRERPLHTRLGTLELQVPKLRQGSYFPSFLEPRRLTERALTAVIQEAWIGGMSTRKVDELVQALGMTGISKSQVSALCQDIDERVESFLERPLEGEWPYLWLDATYLKVRKGGRVVSVAAIIASGVNRDGRREILGLGLGDSEAQVFWVDFLRRLRQRGLSGVQLVISDAHEGLKAAIVQVFTASWQRCRVHFLRNLLACVPKTRQSLVGTLVRQVFVQPDANSAQTAWRQVADQLRSHFPKAAELMDPAEADVLAHLQFPAAHRLKIHSTNPLERLNKEVKRRANVVGIFPNKASIRRLIGAVLMEQNEEWLLQQRYLPQHTLADTVLETDTLAALPTT